MHTEYESIAQYIRVLKKAQDLATRAGITTTDKTLVMIAKKAMLATQLFSKTDDK